MSAPAIHIQNLSLEVGQQGHRRLLLRDISLSIPSGHFAAIIGSTGCGKTTLLRVIMGMLQPSAGQVSLFGGTVEHFRRSYPLGLGYLPQFAEAHLELTVEEILNYACSLQLPSAVDMATRQQWITYLLTAAGIAHVRHQRYRYLSGGQKRRLAMTEALVSDPPLLLVDELTSGLDPQTEAGMMNWLKTMAHQTGKTIVLVTHAVQSLDQTDSVLFMKDGRLLFHGTYPELRQTIGIDSIEELYSRDEVEITHTIREAQREGRLSTSQAFYSAQPAPLRSVHPASTIRQFLTLGHRQLLLLKRDTGQIVLHLVMLFTFPGLVAVFALRGLPQVRNLSLGFDKNILQMAKEQMQYMQESMSAATLVSGLIMFQVILLTLSAANNGSREIAKERSILQKEQRSGLSTVAYVCSKFLMVAIFSLVQAFWMTWFVKAVCKFPGAFPPQLGILLLTTLAMSTTCLAISAYANSSEKASLIAIYLVGLQLPLSGSILALPDWLVWVTRPFIAAYWGWSGYLKCLTDYPIYDIVRQASHTWLSSPSLVAFVLGAHMVLAFALCLVFVRKLRTQQI